MPKKTLTLAFIGRGEVSVKNARSLLNEELEAVDGNVKFIIPVSTDLWNDSLETVAAYALKNEIPIEVVGDDTMDQVKAAKPYLDEALKTHKVAKVTRKLVGLLADSPNPRLIILWDDEDEDAAQAFELADEEGVEAFDLTNGLDKIEFGDADDEEPEEAPAEPTIVEEEAPAKPAAKAADYSEEDLLELADAGDLKTLKAIAEEMSIEVPARTRAKTYVVLIMAAMGGKTISPETGAIEHVVPEEADQSEDGDEAQIPEEEEDDDAVVGSYGSTLDPEAVLSAAWSAVMGAKIPEALWERAFGLSIQLTLERAYDEAIASAE